MPTTVTPPTGVSAAAITPPTGASATARFLAHLPRFEAHARFAFRRVGCPHTRADRISETIGLAWRHFAALSRRGKKPEQFVTTLALRCSQAVKAGRKLVRCEGGKDVLSPVAQVRHGVSVMRLPDRDQEWEHHPLPDELTKALSDNTRSAVPEQAAFRLDFPRWRASLRRRDRRVLDALAGWRGPGRGRRAARSARGRARRSPTGRWRRRPTRCPEDHPARHTGDGQSFGTSRANTWLSARTRSFPPAGWTRYCCTAPRRPVRVYSLSRFPALSKMINCFSEFWA